MLVRSGCSQQLPEIVLNRSLTLNSLYAEEPQRWNPAGHVTSSVRRQTAASLEKRGHSASLITSRPLVYRVPAGCLVSHPEVNAERGDTEAARDPPASRRAFV